MIHPRSLAILFALLIASQLSLAVAQAECPGVPVPRLVIGEQGAVTPGQANNVRATPAKKGTLVGKLPSGTAFDVLAGPTCADGFNWWQVKSADLSGWTPEGQGVDYWLRPAILLTTEGNLTKVDYYDGVRFSFDPSLAAFVRLLYFEDSGLDVMIPHPAGTAFRLVAANTKDEQHDRVGQIELYRVKDFDKLGMTEDIDGLRKLLDNQPTDLRYVPVIPMPNAGQQFLAQIKYVSPVSGKGIRFITAYVQVDIAPVTRGTTEYIYMGLTDSGYLINAAFKTSTKVLPRVASLPDAATYSQYLAGITQILNQQPDDGFTPNLAQIDALIQTLEIQ